ncbi:hypothetical protein [Pseudomonas sp. EMN2]|uniref:hypothetical protein n=1 Tax=Pseudomonas sp. EMN2 TaxID=2615212 RepID=UPI00129B0E3B|nr:hypothetical protein [Pseudomonas sp. EMN2]
MPLISNDICQDAKTWLLEMDDNGDGKVSLEEFRKRFEDYHTSEDMERILALMDVNDNGFIETGETLLRLDRSAACE